MFDTCLHRLAVHASRRATAERRPTSVSAAGSLTVQMLLLDVHALSHLKPPLEAHPLRNVDEPYIANYRCIVLAASEDDIILYVHSF